MGDIHFCSYGTYSDVNKLSCPVGTELRTRLKLSGRTRIMISLSVLTAIFQVDLG